jgi:hypothetical protein
MTKLGLIALVLAGCTRVDSDDILTSGIHAQIGATANGDGTTRVSATLYLGNPINLNFVDLTGGDRLIARGGDEEKVMTETIILNIVGHSATFQTDNEDDEFEVAFVREVDGGAPSSIATLPAPFEIDPVAASVSRAAALDLTWDTTAPDLMRWSASGDCIDSAGDDIGTDEGGTTLLPSTLQKRQGSMVADSCVVTLTVTRQRLGELDPAYGEGGSVSGEQVRTVQFMSTP